MIGRPPSSTLFPTTPLFRSAIQGLRDAGIRAIYAHGVPTGGEWWAFSELEHPEDIRRIRDTYFSSDDGLITLALDRKSTRLNSSHSQISYAVFCLTQHTPTR